MESWLVRTTLTLLRTFARHVIGKMVIHYSFAHHQAQPSELFLMNLVVELPVFRGSKPYHGPISGIPFVC